MASAHAIIGLNFTIIAIIVLFSVTACLNLRPADHWTMIMRYKANIESAGGTDGDRIWAAIVSLHALLFRFLTIVAIIQVWTIIAIIGKHKTAIWIGI